jgi:hypothetical protein
VGEVGARDEVLGVRRRGGGELVVRGQRGEAVVGALAVEQAEGRRGHHGDRRGAGRHVDIGAGGAGADAVALRRVVALGQVECTAGRQLLRAAAGRHLGRVAEPAVGRFDRRGHGRLGGRRDGRHGGTLLTTAGSRERPGDQGGEKCVTNHCS